jgi:hypothetical protein
MSLASMSELVHELDLPELESISEVELASDFMPAAIAGLSDGDMTVINIDPSSDPEKVKFYGGDLFNNGLVAQRMRQAAIATANRPGPVYSFQALASDYCNLPGSPFYHSEISEQAVKIYPEILSVDDNPIALRKAPECVVDYTACLSSRSLLRDQIGFVEAGQRPFAYVGITRMHFTNLMLMNSYDRNFGTGIADTMIQQRFYMGREDGIASASDEIISAQTAAGGPVEIADIIICNGGQHTTREELERGTANAYTITKDEGLFIIRAFAKPSIEEIGTDEIAEWAFEAGFKEQTALEYEGEVHSVGAALLRAQAAERTLKTIVLAK